MKSCLQISGTVCILYIQNNSVRGDLFVYELHEVDPTKVFKKNLIHSKQQGLQSSMLRINFLQKNIFSFITFLCILMCLDSLFLSRF